MYKRAQFYLIAAVVIIAVILGFVAISNSLEKKDFTNIEISKEELEIESQAVLDYINYQGADADEKLENFTKLYSNYTEVENIYFVYGITNDVEVAAFRKFSDATILVNDGNVNNEMDIPAGIYTSQHYSPSSNIILTINNIKHDFEIKQGKNFYFVFSEDREGEDYVFTGSAIKDE